MSRLIVLNGPPGCGKSTIADRWIAEHPMALNLEIDRLRRQLGRWRDDPHRAGLLARSLALAAAQLHLRAGLDVVLPQYLGRVDYLRDLESTAAHAGSDYREIVLMDNRDVLAARFLTRNATSPDPMHRDAQQVLERSGGPGQLAAMYDRLLLVIAARPQAHVITTHEGKIEDTYRRVAALVE